MPFSHPLKGTCTSNRRSLFWKVYTPIVPGILPGPPALLPELKSYVDPLGGIFKNEKSKSDLLFLLCYCLSGWKKKLDVLNDPLFFL